jgi:hypothetical protein
MSKKFKGKTCAYCARDKATTVDHVFVRIPAKPNAISEQKPNGIPG